MAEGQTSTGFFLGANSARGFVSLYDGFNRPDPLCFHRIIKGGPGCGKSSFMRRIGDGARAAGYAVEYIFCSGDPDSLDGIRIPALGVSYADGTAPHVQEPPLPGAAGDYVDLGQFLSREALAPRYGELEALTRAYRAKYQEAYPRLAAAAALLPKNTAGLRSDAVTEKLRQRAAAAAARELPSGGDGGCTRRFLSAVTCRGRLRLDGTLCALCDRIWLLDNSYGGGHEFLAALEAEAAKRGCRRILCPDPLEPEKPEALLFPGLRIGFLADDGSATSAALPIYRHLRLDALTDPPAVLRPTLRKLRRESELLLRAGEASLAQAKALHDALEVLYRPCVDFAGVDAVAEAHLRALGLE